MKIKPVTTHEINFGASPILDTHMNLINLDDLDFGAVLDASNVLHEQPATPGRVAIYTVAHEGRRGFLIANPDGSGMLIESAANDEPGTHEMLLDARARGLI